LLKSLFSTNQIKKPSFHVMHWGSSFVRLFMMSSIMS